MSNTRVEMNTEDAPQASGSVPASVAPCSHSTEAIESCAVRATVSTLDGGPDAPAGISANQDKALPPVRGPSLGRSGGPTMDDVYASIMQKVRLFLQRRAAACALHGHHGRHSSPCMVFMSHGDQFNPKTACGALVTLHLPLVLPPPAEIPRLPRTSLTSALHHARDGDLDRRRRRGSHRGGGQPPQRGVVRGGSRRRRCCRRRRRRQPRLHWLLPRPGPALHHDGRV